MSPQSIVEAMPTTVSDSNAQPGPPGRKSAAGTAGAADMLTRLHELSISGLPLMYEPAERMFVFRVRPNAGGLVREGLSRRYTAITAIGLAAHADAAEAVLGKGGIETVSSRILDDVATVTNMGDVALTLWAARALKQPELARALDRLRVLDPVNQPHPTVEVAWALSALCVDEDPMDARLRTELANRLLQAFNAETAIFPHMLGGASSARSHVACFADLVYPMQALARYGKLTGDQRALDAALRCARHICASQGSDGQWWWHYDVRTGHVVEGYPVYAVHQDAMAPMALFEVAEATGVNFDREIALGLSWLESSPELEGKSLIDPSAGIIWRKVARKEPNKLSRYMQAAASSVHPSLRAPGLDTIFPPETIDFEDRPYHLGWVLYSWPAARVARFRKEAGR